MDREWWRSASGYQIYIRSFKDGNNDGIGDLKGIRQKLNYIKSIGVDFIWICPFYDSPMEDNGYDVRDYLKVAQEYGSMTDLKKLILDAHSLGLKVVLDLVLNHTSSTHNWFKKSENRIPPYEDMYVWKDGKEINGVLSEPNNWQSFFSGTAWKYSPKRKQYYLRIFSATMPDINYENDVAFEKIAEVVDFYGNMGVDGFRVDAVAHIGKDLKFKDGKKGKTYLRFSNQPNAHKYLQKLNAVFKKNNMVTIGELGGDPDDKALLKYTHNELDMVCSFEHMGVFGDKHTINTSALLKTLKRKEKLGAKGGWATLFWLNHDYPRLISKIDGEGDAKNGQICLSALMYLLKGTPIIYNGEEIGMQNYPFASPKDFLDVNARMVLENAEDKEKAFANLKESTRDHARTVMQWTDEKYAGFSNVKPLTYVNKNYKKINAEKASLDKNSILNNYRKILELRKNIIDEICDGKYKFYSQKGVIGYKICGKHTNILVLANLSSNNYTPKSSITQMLYSNMKYSNNLAPYQIIVAKINK